MKGFRAGPFWDAAVIGWCAGVAYGGWTATAILLAWFVGACLLHNVAIGRNT